MAAALFLDLSAGFDVIDHDILIEKLKLYKFSSGAVELFANYLTNRYQCVQVELGWPRFKKSPEKCMLAVFSKSYGILE